MPRRRKYLYHKDNMLPETSADYIFVFGSNLRGAHGKGAALVAKEQFGAECGIGLGLTGKSYAIPTKDRYIRTLMLADIKVYIQSFADFTHNRPNSKFWVTRVGCGLAGYTDQQIAPYFSNCNTNCIFPEQWIQYLH